MTEHSNRPPRPAPWWLWGLFALPFVISWFVRPIFPVDETRYLAVAWEMWSHHEFLIPHLNGALYVDKPPVLFWLMHLGWLFSGVNGIWPRLIQPLALAASLWLIHRLARRAWPGRPSVATYAPLLFAGGVYVAMYSMAIMFDLLVVLETLIVLDGLLTAAEGRRGRGFFQAGLVLGIAYITKGPVILVYLLPAALVAPYWTQRPANGWWRWYAGVVLAVLGSALIPALWLGLGTWHAGTEWLNHVLFDQTLNRVQGQIGHPRPLYWYLPLLPVALAPWSIWPPLWRAIFTREGGGPDRMLRLVLVCSGGALLILSLVGGKQAHYLLPAIAIASLAGARCLSGAPLSARRWHAIPVCLGLIAIGIGFLAATHGHVHTDAEWVAGVPNWGGWLLIAVGAGLWLVPVRTLIGGARLQLGATTLLAFVLVVCLEPAAKPAYDMTAMAQFVARSQAENHPVAYVGHYQGQFNFFGRLTQPVINLSADEADAWVNAHPQGLVVVRDKRINLGAGVKPVFSQPYRSGGLLMFENDQLIGSGTSFFEPKDGDED